MDNIKAINIIFENGENIILNKEDVYDLYVANIDNEGREIPYSKTKINHKMYANLMIIKIINGKIDIRKIDRITNKKDIVELELIMNNQKSVKFIVPSCAEPFNNYYYNECESIVKNANYTGLLLSEYKIKYLNNLFV